MSRRHAVVAVAVLVVGGLLPLASARAGGFCSGEVGTYTEFADRVGDTVTMVERGTTVAFVNKDGTVHSVGGAAGTFGDLHREIAGGERARYTFETDGVFPYACVFHPGMTGAIVVGDGEGDGVAGIVRGDPSSSKPAGTAAGVPTLALPLGIALVLLVAAIAALGARRKDAATTP